jgi:outer membrane protein assembly factor BamB
MRFEKSAIAGMLAAALVAGCGGGGGGGNTVSAPVSNGSSPTPTVPVPAPSSSRVSGGSGSLVVFADTGASAPFVLSASIVTAAGDTLRTAVVDSKGLVRQYREPLLSASEMTAYLETAATLVPGDHETTLELRVCRDDPLVCNSPVTGSPLRVGLKIRTGRQGSLTPLQTIPGLQPWRTYNGNAAHTGFVPADFNPASFTRRWSLAGGAAYLTGAQVPALDNGRAFVTHRNDEGLWEVVAIDEASGEIAWRHAVDRTTHLNPPAAAHGSVYFTTTSTLGTSEFLSISQINGGYMFRAALPVPDLVSYFAPTVSGDAVYASAGKGRMLKFRSQTSQLDFSSAALPSFASWTPALDGGQAYVFLDKRLYALNTADGSVAYDIFDQEANVFSSTAEAPVLGGGKAFVVKSDRVVAFDLQTRARAWTRPVGTGPQPALGNGALYVIDDSSRLEAIDPATGALLWQTHFPMIDRSQDYFRRVIISNNLAFVAGWKRTVAIDLATHQVVWSYPLGGDLAISDRGVLYIASIDTGRVDAISLR